MKVFFSWSGNRSKKFAEELSYWLKRVIQTVQPWVSNQDISAGSRWSTEIGNSLAGHDIGIICVTPENMEASWINFEAGALSKLFDQSRVCPVLFGMLPGQLKGPLSVFQASTCDKEGMWKLVQNLNDLQGDLKIEDVVLQDSFKLRWPDFETRMKTVSEIDVGNTRESLDNVLDALQHHGLPKCLDCSNYYFGKGFETHSMYSSVSEASEQRLMILGRKNRKFFDKEYKVFFSQLKKKIDEGFDFRCLFLNPSAPMHVIQTAHVDSDFPQQLQQSIIKAFKFLQSHDIDPSKVCRLYQTTRNYHMVFSDNSVLFTPVQFDVSGKAISLTNTSFTITGAKFGIGENMLRIFNEIWDSSTPLAGDLEAIPDPWCSLDCSLVKKGS